MDPLRREIFKAIVNSTTGDAKIDELNLNASKYFNQFIIEYENEVTKINNRKQHFTPAGLKAARAKARAKIMKEMKDFDELANWKTQIKEVEKKFDVEGSEKSDLQILIQEGREREIRSEMRKLGGDALKFETEFGPLIQAADPLVCGAIVNAPLKIQMSSEMNTSVIENYRLSKNPFAADRLKTLTAAKDQYESLKTFTLNEIGAGEEDKIKIMAAG